MKRLLLALLLLSRLALAGQGMGPGPMVGPFGGGGGGGLTAQMAQEFTANSVAFGTAGSAVTLTLASAPLANQLAVCFLGAGPIDGASTPMTTAPTPTDSFADAGVWSHPTLNPVTQGGQTIWVFYKTLSANAASNTITLTQAGTGSSGMGLHCGIAKVASGTPTWALDGTPVSSTGSTVASSTTTVGSITTSNTTSLVAAFGQNGGAAFTAGSGFVIRGSTTTGGLTQVSEDLVTTSAGSTSVSFFFPGGSAQSYSAVGIAFKAN